MRTRIACGAILGAFLSVSGNSASAKDAAVDDPATAYIACLQGGMSTASTGNRSSAHPKILDNCAPVRRAVAKDAEALLLSQGTDQERAHAQVEDMLAAAEHVEFGISGEKPSHLYATYERLEDQLSELGFSYKIQPNGEVDCLITATSGDAELDATVCKSTRNCMRPGASSAANNDVGFDCMSIEQRKELFSLAVKREGLKF